MERHSYPVLRDRPELIYLDASNGFPLHEVIINSVSALASSLVGMPGKAQYGDGYQASAIVEQTRQKIAKYINADSSEVFFVSSATEAARLLAEEWCLRDTTATVAYSPEDHTATSRALANMAPDRLRLLAYNETGQYQNLAEASVYFVNHLHHLYGTDIVPSDIKERSPNSRLVVDASQSISRLEVDVKAMQADALYFSGHKLGAMGGSGVLFVAKAHHGRWKPTDFGGASLPLLAIASMGRAIDILASQSMFERDKYLAELTGYAISVLETVPGVVFSKGITQALDMCTGSGIVSFKLRGLSSTDVMLFLDEHNISVRGGDHCVSPEFADQDFVRISMQAYTTHDDIDRLVEVIRQMV